MTSKQNPVKRKFSYIDTFDHDVPAAENEKRDLTSGVFEHLGKTSSMDVDQSVA